MIMTENFSTQTNARHQTIDPGSLDKIGQMSTNKLPLGISFSKYRKSKIKEKL